MTDRIWLPSRRRFLAGTTLGLTGLAGPLAAPALG